MSWNYRVLANEYKEGKIYFQVHEVYYNEDGVPDGYTENPITIGGEDTESVGWTIDKIMEGYTKPVLWMGDRFPEKFEENA